MNNFPMRKGLTCLGKQIPKHLTRKSRGYNFFKSIFFVPLKSSQNIHIQNDLAFFI